MSSPSHLASNSSSPRILQSFYLYWSTKDPAFTFRIFSLLRLEGLVEPFWLANTNPHYELGQVYDSIRVPFQVMPTIPTSYCVSTPGHEPKARARPGKSSSRLVPRHMCLLWISIFQSVKASSLLTILQLPGVDPAEQPASQSPTMTHSLDLYH